MALEEDGRFEVLKEEVWESLRLSSLFGSFLVNIGGDLFLIYWLVTIVIGIISLPFPTNTILLMFDPTRRNTCLSNTKLSYDIIL